MTDYTDQTKRLVNVEIKDLLDYSLEKGFDSLYQLKLQTQQNLKELQRLNEMLDAEILRYGQLRRQTKDTSRNHEHLSSL